MSVAVKSDLCEINVKVRRSSERAALVATAFRDCEPVWVPLSLVDLSPNGDGTHMLVIPEWLAIDKGLV